MPDKGGQLKLTGREAAQRVAVLRRPLAGELLMVQEGEHGQQWLSFIEADRAAGKRITCYEYAVLVTNMAHEVLSLGRLQVSARLHAWAKEAAEQFRTQAVWRCVCAHLKQMLAAIGSPPTCLKIGYDTA